MPKPKKGDHCMFAKKLIPATLAAVIALGTAGVAFADSEDNENSKEITAVLNAKTSISQAIAAAEKQTGGRAMKADVDDDEDVHLYKIRIVEKDKVSEVLVDPASGEVTQLGDRGLIAKIFDNDDQAEFENLAASPVTLPTAVATAEKEIGGKAIQAAFESEDGQSQFEVHVAKDKAVHKVKIDAGSGQVVKVSAAENGERDDD
jgi:uncharacterized membrane protein YkoI